MKKIGKIIFACLVAALVFVVPVMITELSHNGSKNGNSTMSLADAKVLVDTVCTAFNSSKSSSTLSTASTTGYYEYDVVRDEDVGYDAVYGYLLVAKYALEDGEGDEDYLKSPVLNGYHIGEGLITTYLGYRLIDNGIRIMLRLNSEDQSAHNVIEVTYEDKDKKEWKLFTYSTHDCVYCKHDDDGRRHFMNLHVVWGENLKIKRVQWHTFQCDDSIYENPLTTDSLCDLECVDINAVSHEKQMISLTDAGRTDENYKDKDGNLIRIDGFTSESFASWKSATKSVLENSWLPNLNEKQFKDSDFMQRWSDYLTNTEN